MSRIHPMAVLLTLAAGGVALAQAPPGEQQAPAGQQAQPQQGQQGQQAAETPQHATPERQVMIVEDVWLTLLEVPSRGLEQARAEYLNDKRQEAATDIRASANFMKLVESHAKHHADLRHLNRAIKDLDELAAEVERGRVEDVSSLDVRFAQAEHALASHYHREAKDAYEHGRHPAAGHYLRASANDLERAAKWSGHELEAGTKDVIHFSRTVSGKLIEGVGFVPDEVGKAITGIGHGIEKVGHAIEPRRETGRHPGA